MSIKGGCLCGAVKYEITGSLEFAGNCHCSICRKLHGAAYVTWTFVKPGQFKWISGKESLGTFKSSPERERLFCSICSTPLAASHHGNIGEVVLGSIDGDPGVKPTEHIFVGSKAPWHEITDELPQYEQWPPGINP